MNVTLKDFIAKNCIAIISIILGIGGFIAVIRAQGLNIYDNSSQIDADKERLVMVEKSIIEMKSIGNLIDANNSTQIAINTIKLGSVEKSLVKLDSMQNDIADIKTDIREIKKSLMNPNYKMADMYQYTHGSTASR